MIYSFSFATPNEFGEEMLALEERSIGLEKL
jgi:hypothetical protein